MAEDRVKSGNGISLLGQEWRNLYVRISLARKAARPTFFTRAARCVGAIMLIVLAATVGNGGWMPWVGGLFISTAEASQQGETSHSDGSELERFLRTRASNPEDITKQFWLYVLRDEYDRAIALMTPSDQRNMPDDFMEFLESVTKGGHGLISPMTINNLRPLSELFEIRTQRRGNTVHTLLSAPRLRDIDKETRSTLTSASELIDIVREMQREGTISTRTHNGMNAALSLRFQEIDGHWYVDKGFKAQENYEAMKARVNDIQRLIDRGEISRAANALARLEEDDNSSNVKSSKLRLARQIEKARIMEKIVVGDVRTYPEGRYLSFTLKNDSNRVLDKVVIKANYRNRNGKTIGSEKLTSFSKQDGHYCDNVSLSDLASDKPASQQREELERDPEAFLKRSKRLREEMEKNGPPRIMGATEQMEQIRQKRHNNPDHPCHSRNRYQNVQLKPGGTWPVSSVKLPLYDVPDNWSGEIGLRVEEIKLH